MTKSLLVLFILVPTLVTAQFFNVKTSEIKTGAPVIAAADFKQFFFCLREDGTLMRIDSSTTEVYNQHVTVRTLTDLYSERDTLFGVAGKDSLFYFNGDDFRYSGRRREEKPLYSDAMYTVVSTCSGEFGGSLYFVDRKTGKKFACSAACPVMVNRTDTSYIVTVSLAHLMGSTEILEIKYPDQMREYNYIPPRGRKVFVGENESHSRQGIKVLAHSMGAITIGTFQIEKEILHIVTNFHQTYICRIRNGAFETIQQLADKSFGSYKNENWSNRDGVVWSFFLNHEHNGMMRIAGRNIHVYLFSNKSSVN